MLTRQARYARRNREKMSRYHKRWYRLNKKRLINASIVYHRKRYSESLEYRLSRIHGSRLRQAVIFKKGHSSPYLGCSIKKLVAHIESQLTIGMTWDNYGEWHIDHIKPLCTFDLSKEKEIKTAFNYNNLRPLWAEENLSRKRKTYADREEVQGVRHPVHRHQDKPILL